MSYSPKNAPITKPGSVAAMLLDGLRSAEQGILSLELSGIRETRLCIARQAIRAALFEAERLADIIPDGRHQACGECEHRVVLLGPHGDFRDLSCSITRPSDCPLLRKAGFLSDADLAADLIPSVRRQAS